MDWVKKKEGEKNNERKNDCFVHHGFCSCSLRKNRKQRTLTEIMKRRQTQKSALDRPWATPAEKSGKTSPGPTLSGAVARARIVPMEPMTWAASRVKAMWKRVRVLRRIMPKPVSKKSQYCSIESHYHFCMFSRGKKGLNTYLLPAGHLGPRATAKVPSRRGHWLLALQPKEHRIQCWMSTRASGPIWESPGQWKRLERTMRAVWKRLQRPTDQWPKPR